MNRRKSWPRSKGTLTRYGTKRRLAEEAGLSLHQYRQAVRVATIPEAKFERLIESDDPPTVEWLAIFGCRRRTAGRPSLAESDPALADMLEARRLLRRAARVTRVLRCRPQLEAVAGEVDRLIRDYRTALASGQGLMSAEEVEQSRVESAKVSKMEAIAEWLPRFDHAGLDRVLRMVREEIERRG